MVNVEKYSDDIFSGNLRIDGGNLQDFLLMGGERLIIQSANPLIINPIDRNLLGTKLIDTIIERPIDPNHG